MSTPLPMNTGRWVALAIGTPLALLLIGHTALSMVAYAGQGSYRISLNLPAHGSTVSVANDSGDISVSPGAGNLIRLRGTAHFALIRSRVTWQRTPLGVAVHSQCDQPAGPCSFAYRVTVPAGLATVLTSASGDLTAHGLALPVLLRDSSGDIHVAALSGAVRLSDSSGDITGRALSGPQVFIEDESGDVTIMGLASRDVTAANESGDITLMFTRVPDRVIVSDASGDISLVLPPGPTAYRVAASTQSGTTSVSVPQNSSSTHVITVTDQSGNISVAN